MLTDIVASTEFKKKGGRRPEYYKYVLTQDEIIDGLWLEFGVFKGTTLKILASRAPGVVYGFDSFAGLPTDWIGRYKEGYFKISDTPRLILGLEENNKIKVVSGYFDDTLPPFLDEHTGNCAVVHIDCDLYASTQSVFRHLEKRIVPGTLVLFDEIHYYKGYEEHEYRAFSEFLERTNQQCHWVAHLSNAPQAACFIL